jgi:hypothetical protein
MDSIRQDDGDPLLDLDLDEAEPLGDPPKSRFGLILATGLVLIGLAAVFRSVLEGAAPAPPGLMEPKSAGPRAPEPGSKTSVARYEFERARALR